MSRPMEKFSWLAHARKRGSLRRPTRGGREKKPWSLVARQQTARLTWWIGPRSYLFNPRNGKVSAIRGKVELQKMSDARPEDAKARKKTKGGKRTFEKQCQSQEGGVRMCEGCRWARVSWLRGRPETPFRESRVPEKNCQKRIASMQFLGESSGKQLKKRE